MDNTKNESEMIPETARQWLEDALGRYQVTHIHSSIREALKAMAEPQAAPRDPHPRNKTEELIAFLKKVPDQYLISEANRRISARRRPTRPTRKVLRPCRFCGDFFGAQEMRTHVREQHPGGERKHTPLAKLPIGLRCQYCPEVHGTRAMRKHVREKHPEHCPGPTIVQPGYHDPAGKGA